MLTPYTPVPDSNGEEWDRLEPASALDVLVELALHGEYNSGMDSEKRLKDGLELRAAVVGVFEVNQSSSIPCILSQSTPELCSTRDHTNCNIAGHAPHRWR